MVKNNLVDPAANKLSPAQYKSIVKNLNFYYGDFNALRNIDMVLHE